MTLIEHTDATSVPHMKIGLWGIHLGTSSRHSQECLCQLTQRTDLLKFILMHLRVRGGAGYALYCTEGMFLK